MIEFHHITLEKEADFMRLGNLELENPVALAPMAGVTDWAYRTVCAELGAGLTVTEMVSSRALVYKDKKSAALLRKNENSICGLARICRSGARSRK